MDKKIIILERINEPSDFSIRYVFWLPVPLSIQSHYSKASPASLYPAANTDELTKIQKGEILEINDTLTMPANTPISSVQAKLIELYNEKLSELTNQKKYGYFGTFWDGKSWNVPGV